MVDLRQGDCMEILKTLADKSVDLVITDPPYALNTTPGNGQGKLASDFTSTFNEIKLANISEGYDLETVNKELIRVMKKINIYIWCNKKQLLDYLNFYVVERECKFEILCWHKSTTMPNFSNKYLTDTEFCLYFHKDAAKTHPKCFDDARTYWVYPTNKEDKKLYGHPTIKPLKMIEKLVRNSSDEGDVVLDCFMGSGTTGVACRKHNRDFIGIEINPEYFETAKKRIEGPIEPDLW